MGKPLPDTDYIRECIDYSPQAGTFTWRERPLHHFPHLTAQRWWNGRFAGEPAGWGSNDRTAYWRLCFGHYKVKAHRVAWLLVYGEPVPEILDHIDGNKLNNRINNLRAVTNWQNAAGQKTRDGTFSGVKGVYFRRRGNSERFVVHIGWLGRKHWVGSFTTLDEAIAARREAADRLYGKFAKH